MFQPGRTFERKSLDQRLRNRSSQGVLAQKHHSSEGGVAQKFTQGDPYQNLVVILQDLPKDGGKSVLPLAWLWIYGRELPGAQPKQ